MPYLFCYTKQGADKYRDLNDSMHLAVSLDGTDFTPLRHNTGILFPEADLNDGTMPGCTKTLLYPWLFRMKDGSGAVVAVRRNNNNEPDPLSIGSIMVYQTENFVNYRLVRFLKLGSHEIRNPQCRYDDICKCYHLKWDTEEGQFRGVSDDLITIHNITRCEPELLPLESYGIKDTVPGNIIEISSEELNYVNHTLGLIYHIGNKHMELTLPVGTKIDASKLPQAVCLYNDGSEHRMPVDWDSDSLYRIDTTKPGTTEMKGQIVQKLYPFPFIEDASDPCIFHYGNKYYFTATGNRSVNLRVSDTIVGLRDAEVIVLYQFPEEDQVSCHMWAQELHLIKGIPYIFTTVGQYEKWNTVQSHILRCNGDIEDPFAWEEPCPVRKKDGTLLNENGITLDMTYFCIDDVHYVSWANRDILYNGDERNLYGTSNGPSDIYIATIDPDRPWQLITDPVCICRPIYGWDRIETQVDEGPYLLRHNDDLFLTFSGSSVGVLYCVGLLHAKYGSDLLSPDSWEETPYPVLTKESIQGQYGPGHNNFVKDPDSEYDLMVLHAKPYPTDTEPNPRHATIRRVHWNAAGYPVFDMTPEQEINPEMSDVTLTIRMI